MRLSLPSGLWKLALRNVLRHRLRTGMTLAAIAFGVAGLILAGGFVEDVFHQLGEAVIHSQFGHVQVAKRGYFEAGVRSGGAYRIDGYRSLQQGLAAIDGVEFTTARYSFTGLLNNGKADWAVLGEGVEPDKEARLGSFLRIIRGRQLQAGDRAGLVIGEGVAHTLHLAPGDRVTLLANTPEGALNTFDAQVVGVFQSFSRDYDARAVRIDLAAAQSLMGHDTANVLVTVLTDTARTAAVAQQAHAVASAQDMEVRTWSQLSDFYAKAVALYDRQFGVLILIVLLLVLLSVANTVNMAAMERVGEFGTMMALGDPPRRLAALIMAESVLLGLGGALLGVVLGIIAAQLISGVGIPMPPPPNANVGYTAYIRLVPGMIISAFAVGLVGTVLAAVLPALRSARMPVVDALRRAV
jgi:putative ABC transport system permease protein